MRLSSVIIVEHRNSETRHFCCRPAKKSIVVLAKNQNMSLLSRMSQKSQQVRFGSIFYKLRLQSRRKWWQPGGVRSQFSMYVWKVQRQSRVDARGKWLCGLPRWRLVYHCSCPSFNMASYLMFKHRQFAGFLCTWLESTEHKKYTITMDCWILIPFFLLFPNDRSANLPAVYFWGNFSGGKAR